MFRYLIFVSIWIHGAGGQSRALFKEHNLDEFRQ